MDENQEQSTAQEEKKSNPSLVIGILFVIALIAGAFWFMSSNNQPATQDQTTQTETTVSEEPTQAATESATESAADSAMGTIGVEGGEFYFKPNEIRVKKGEKVTITLSNAGKMPHNFVVDEFNVESKTIDSGTTTFEFTPDKAGTFEFYCSVGTHRAMGMKGNLIVE